MSLYKLILSTRSVIIQPVAIISNLYFVRHLDFSLSNSYTRVPCIVCRCQCAHFSIYNTLVPRLKFLTGTLGSQKKMFFGERSNLNDYGCLAPRLTVNFKKPQNLLRGLF